MKKTINENERKVLEQLAESFDSFGETGYFAFKSLEKVTGLERKVVKRACRSLAKKGLAEFMRGLTDGEGGMAGSGYGATEKGAALMSPCDDCGALAHYDWFDKNGAIVLRSDAGAVRKRKCVEHYSETPLTNPLNTL